MRETTDSRGGHGAGNLHLEASCRGQCKSRPPRRLYGNPGERGSGPELRGRKEGKQQSGWLLVIRRGRRAGDEGIIVIGKFLSGTHHLMAPFTQRMNTEWERVWIFCWFVFDGGRRSRIQIHFQIMFASRHLSGIYVHVHVNIFTTHSS